MFDHYHLPGTSAITGDDLAIQQLVRKFARDLLQPAAQQLDEEAAFAGRHLQDLGELGIMGLNLPESVGGAGASYCSLTLAIEAIASACASTASMITAHYLATDAIFHGGNADQQTRYLKNAASGKSLGAFALTEPDAGSNPAAITTLATVIDGGYHIKGNKQFISNARYADFIIVFAQTDLAAGHRGIAAYIVDSATPGIEFGLAEKTMGLKGGQVFPITLDCEIKNENCLARPGDGFKLAMQVLDHGRIEVAAICLGIAQAAYSAACKWAGERMVDDDPLANRQGIQWMIADMATDLEAARLMALNASMLRDQQRSFSRESAMAKLYCSEMAGRVTDTALQIHGGYGYARDFPLERYARDARILRIYEGSSEVQRNIIARNILAP
ncbi:MAG: alkylation response protein AidB-like acyl-CoA dehydrogenase [Planctomycetota bacterium]|jgi:alkylation response protein AidB-like acyl-CoA dehydrogenase